MSTRGPKKRRTGRARRRPGTGRPGLEALKTAAQDALVYAIMADTDRCAGAIGDICEMGPRAVHAALSGWAGDITTGQIVSIDEMRNPAARDAVRLVSCIGNGGPRHHRRDCQDGHAR
jgi:hypothetical protein